MGLKVRVLATFNIFVFLDSGSVPLPVAILGVSTLFGDMDVLSKKTVLILCTHNSARSQMAEGLLRAFHGDRFEVFSAGTEATRVKPMAIEVMAEIGIDLSEHHSKTLERFLNRDLDYVVTVCDSARENCPYIPGAHESIHHSFSDPSDVTSSENERREAFRTVRDEIKIWLDRTFT